MALERATELLRRSMEGDVLSDEPMSRHTSFRVGGPSDLFVVADTVADLSAGLGILEAEEVEYSVVGKGTNLLVSDAGYRGAVLVLGRDFRHHLVSGETIQAGAAASLAAVVQDAFKHGMSGLGFAVGIPGTVGGALAMNAGTRDEWLGSRTASVTLFAPGQGLERVPGESVGWAYRRSGLAERGIIVEGEFRVSEGDPAAIRAEMERDFRRRKETQPVGRASAGSVFKNPEGESAGRLIEAAGLKGTRVGGARISQTHANFIVNDAGASAADVMSLLRKAQMTVRDVHGVELRPEIEFLGAFE